MQLCRQSPLPQNLPNRCNAPDALPTQLLKEYHMRSFKQPATRSLKLSTVLNGINTIDMSLRVSLFCLEVIKALESLYIKFSCRAIVWAETDLRALRSTICGISWHSLFRYFRDKGE